MTHWIWWMVVRWELRSHCTTIQSIPRMGGRTRLVMRAWEAVMTAGFTVEQVYARVRAIAELLVARRLSCLVASDTRFMGGLLARYAAQVLETQGITTTLCAQPAPLAAVHLALETRRADTALMVTGANRPYYVSGLLLFAPVTEGAPLPDELPVAAGGPVAPFVPQQLEQRDYPQVDLRTPYIELVRSRSDVELIRRTALTVFVDVMHGTAAGLIPAVLGDGAQTKAIEINREPDPLFGRLAPLPLESGMARLRKLVRESDSHVGIGLSADGTALGVVDGSGEVVSAAETAMLLAQYSVRQHRLRGVAVLPGDAPAFAPGSDAQALRIELVPDPAGRIADLVATDRASLLVGTTSSGQITFGRGTGVPDATTAGMLIIELVARAGGHLRSMLEELRRSRP